MNQIEYKFDKATAFQAFIDNNRNKVVGHVLKAIYVDNYMYYKTADVYSPVFLVFDDACIGIEYLYRSEVSIITAEKTDFDISEDTIGERPYNRVYFHSSIPGRHDDNRLLWCKELPFMDQKVTDISIGRINERCELVPYVPICNCDDQFSWLALTLEDGTKLYVDALNVHERETTVWFSDMPAYAAIKAELDKDPWDLYYTRMRDFDYVVWASDPTEAELADLAMYYMRKCDHEVEDRRKESKDTWPGATYTSQMKHILEEFKSRGMRIDHVDATGKSLVDLALEIGEEASSQALPAIFYETMFSSSIARIATSLESEYQILTLNRKDAAAVYSKLPEKVKETSYGRKLLAFSNNRYAELKEKIDELTRDIQAID